MVVECKKKWRSEEGQDQKVTLLIKPIEDKVFFFCEILRKQRSQSAFHTENKSSRILTELGPKRTGKSTFRKTIKELLQEKPGAHVLEIQDFNCRIEKTGSGKDH